MRIRIEKNGSQYDEFDEIRHAPIAFGHAASRNHDANLPSDVVKSTKPLILNSIGCIAGGHSSALAAQANGTALLHLDLIASRNGYNTRKIIGLLPAAIALEGSEGRTGRDLIAAIAARPEMQCLNCEFFGNY